MEVGKIRDCEGILLLSGADNDVVSFVAGLRWFERVGVVDLDLCLRERSRRVSALASITTKIGPDYAVHLEELLDSVVATRNQLKPS